MSHVRLLFVPLTNASKASKAAYHCMDFEVLLLNEGFEVDRVARDDMDSTYFVDSDVCFLEVEEMDNLQSVTDLRMVSRKPLVLFGCNVPESLWIDGLNSGADAYLSLPDSEDVLRARLNAVIRRFGLQQYDD